MDFMEKYTHVVWDFNGTLYDDVDACIRSANRLLSAHGLKRFETVEEYRHSFGFPIIDYYVRMGFDFSKTPYDELAVEWVGYYMEESRASTAYEGAVDVLAELKKRGIGQILLSASEERMLRAQVETLGLMPYFCEVLGQDTIHAYGKREIGCAWREKHSSERVLLIGDTEHDAEVARAMGADCVLLSCGHRPREILNGCGALAVCCTHGELLALLCESINA